MPIRDYVCKTCHKTSEVLERREEEPACGHCGSKDVAASKELPKTNFALKGSGWAKDGYSKAGGR